MVIERFRDNDMVPIYQRLRDQGRSLPDGLEYVDSWIEPNFARCFHLMCCDDARLLQEWVLPGAVTAQPLRSFRSCREKRLERWLRPFLILPLNHRSEIPDSALRLTFHSNPTEFR